MGGLASADHPARPNGTLRQNISPDCSSGLVIVPYMLLPNVPLVRHSNTQPNQHQKE